jgi:hypothetical protein
MHGKDEKFTDFFGNLRQESTSKFRRRWEHNIRMELRENAWLIVDWIHLAQDSDHWRALVNMIMKILLP